MRIAVALVLLLAACSAPRMGETPHNRRDIPPGPGLLTGKAGDWVIYRKDI